MRLIREFHRIKQAEMALKLEISKSYLSEIEAEKKVPTVDLLNRYSTALNIPVSSLMYVAESLDPNKLPSRKAKIASKALKALEWLENTAKP